MPKWDIKDEYGGKIGEIRQTTDWDKTTENTVGGILGCLLVVISALTIGLISGWINLCRRYPKIVLPITGAVLLTVAFLVVSSNRAADEMRRARLEATAVVVAEAENNPDFYSERAENLGVGSNNQDNGQGQIPSDTAPAMLSYDPVDDIGYDIRRDTPVVYFNLSLNNNDAMDHNVIVHIDFTVDVQDDVRGPFSTFQTQFDMMFHLNADETSPTDEIPIVEVATYGDRQTINERRDTLDENEVDGNSARVVWRGLGFEDVRNARDLTIEIIEIDGLPTRDPSAMLANVGVRLEPTSPRIWKSSFVGSSEIGCWFTVTNRDSERHGILGVAFYDYTYTDLGEVKHGEDYVTFGWELEPGASIRGDGYRQPDLLRVEADPSNVQRVQITQVQLSLTDEGLESVPESLLTSVVVPTPTDCNYTNPSNE